MHSWASGVAALVIFVAGYLQPVLADELAQCSGGLDGTLVVGERWTTTSGRTGPGGTGRDDALYEFQAQGGATYAFTLCEEGGNATFQAMLAVHGPGCVGAPLTAGAASCGSRSRLEWTAPTSGTYVLQIAGPSDTAGGFTLAYRSQGQPSRGVVVAPADEPSTRGLVVSPSRGIEAAVIRGGSPGFEGREYVLSNTTDGPIEWRVSATQPWLSIDSGDGAAESTGGLLHAGESRTVRVLVNEGVAGLPSGDYRDAVTIERLHEPDAVSTLPAELSVLEPGAISPSDAIVVATTVNYTGRNVWLARVSRGGSRVWQRTLSLAPYYLQEYNGSRSQPEDALYLLTGVENKAGGKIRLQKYDGLGNRVWDAPVSADAWNVSASVKDGGAYVSDTHTGVYRIDSDGHVVWGPKDWGHPDASGGGWWVAADPYTGGLFAAHYPSGTVLKADHDGNVLWSRTMNWVVRVDANPLDGGVYVAWGGSSGRTTSRLGNLGELFWSRDDFPENSFQRERGVFPSDGSLVIGAGRRVGRLAADGTALWSVQSDDNQGHAWGNLAIAPDIEMDEFYTADAGLTQGLSRFRGSDASLLWHFDPGYFPVAWGGNFYRVFTGIVPMSGLWLEPQDGLDVSGEQGGPFSATTKEYTLFNRSSGPTAWSASPSRPWVSLDAGAGPADGLVSGVLAPGELITIRVSLNDEAARLDPGDYRDTVVFRDESAGSDIASRGVRLTVRRPGVMYDDAFDRADGPVGNGWSTWWGHESPSSRVVIEGGEVSMPGYYSDGAGIYRSQAVEFPLDFSFDYHTHEPRGTPANPNVAGWFVLLNGTAGRNPYYGHAQLLIRQSSGSLGIERQYHNRDGIMWFAPTATAPGLRDFGPDAKAHVEGMIRRDLGGVIRIWYRDGLEPDPVVVPLSPVSDADPVPPGSTLTIGTPSYKAGPHYFDNFEVRKAHLLVEPLDGVRAWSIGGAPIEDGSRTYTLRNTSGEPLTYSVSASQAWIRLDSGNGPSDSPLSGTISPRGSATVTVLVDPAALLLPKGERDEAVTFASVADGDGDTSRTVKLFLVDEPGIFVDDDDTGAISDGTIAHPFRRVQSAVDVADLESGPIYVLTGTYDEGVTIRTCCVSLVGMGEGKSVLQGSTFEGAVVYLDRTSDVTLRDLDLVGGRYGVRARWTQRTSLSSLRIHGLGSSGSSVSYGIWLDGGGDNHVDSCEIFDIGSGGTGWGWNRGAGVYLDQGEADVRNCRIHDISSAVANVTGIAAFNASGAVLENNEIRSIHASGSYYPSDAIGIEIQDGDDVTVSRNVLSDIVSQYRRAMGIWGSRHDGAAISGNRIGAMSGRTLAAGIILGLQSGDPLFHALVEDNDVGLSTIPGGLGTGIRVDDLQVVVRGNSVHDGAEGIVLSDADPSSVKGSIVRANRVVGNRGAGLSLSSSGNTVYANEFGINGVGVRVEAASVGGNTIYHNDFLGNDFQASDPTGGANLWFEPASYTGNFWSDYRGSDDGSGTGKHAIAGDWIGDTMIPHPSAGFDDAPFTVQDGWLRPTAVCPSAVEWACTGNASGAGTLDGASSVDPSCEDLWYRWSSDRCLLDEPLAATTRASCPVGVGGVQFVVGDSRFESAPCVTEVRVVDTTPPSITCPASVTAECQSAGQAHVALVKAMASDSCYGSAAITNSWTSNGADASGTYPLGATVVTFTATDGSGNQAICQTTVTVRDTIAPVVTAVASPNVLWPPNHKMSTVNTTVVATDACDPSPSLVLLSVTSSEPDDAPGIGDGNTTDDIQDASLGTPDFQVLLRAERDADSPGRTYTIAYQVSDHSGNAAFATTVVMVPHDMGQGVEPLNLVMEDSSSTVLIWGPVDGARHYDIIRGDLASLRVDGSNIDLGQVVCIAADTTATTTTGYEDTAIPEPGQVFFYAVQYNDGTQDSSYGSESAGRPRVVPPGGGDCQ